MLKINDEIIYLELKEKVIGSKIPEVLLDDVIDNNSKLVKIGEKRLSNWDGKLYMDDLLISSTETVKVDRSPRNDYNPADANITVWANENEVHVVHYSTSRSHKTRIYEIDTFEIIKD